MKKILVPTDFSKLSDNALNYAVKLAGLTGAELLLLHAYITPVLVEDPVLLTTEQYLQEEAQDKLEKLKQSVEKSSPELTISYVAINGMPVDTITFYAKKKHVDLIVIGTQGAGYFREQILGSTTSTLIRKTEIPLMVIDKQVKFRLLKTIVLAVDFSETDNRVVLKPLKQLAKIFKSHICILNIFTEAHVIPTFGQISESFKLETSLKHTNHTFFEIEHPDVVTGINEFVKKHRIDLVTIISRRHYLVERIFREPISKAMVFHSHAPLLILHE
jgi:nucleotide-binding universal stress UspA family protein